MLTTYHVVWTVWLAGNSQSALNYVITPIVNAYSSKCIMPFARSTQSDACIDLATCDNSAIQNWQIKSASSGSYMVLNAVSGLCLNVNGGIGSAGTFIIQYPCSLAQNMLWTFSFSGSWSIMSVGSGLLLDVYGGTTTDGSSIDQANPTGGSNQLWFLPNIGMLLSPLFCYAVKMKKISSYFLSECVSMSSWDKYEWRTV